MPHVQLVDGSTGVHAALRAIIADSCGAAVVAVAHPSCSASRVKHNSNAPFVAAAAAVVRSSAAAGACRRRPAWPTVGLGSWWRALQPQAPLLHVPVPAQERQAVTHRTLVTERKNIFVQTFAQRGGAVCDEGGPARPVIHSFKRLQCLKTEWGLTTVSDFRAASGAACTRHVVTASPAMTCTTTR